MKSLLLLSALLLAVSSPVHAMTEESSHYDTASQRSHYADEDDALEQSNTAPTSNFQGQSAREQSLLYGNSADHGQTYGFGGYDDHSGYYNEYGSSSRSYGFH